MTNPTTKPHAVTDALSVTSTPRHQARPSSRPTSDRRGLVTPPAGSTALPTLAGDFNLQSRSRVAKAVARCGR